MSAQWEVRLDWSGSLGWCSKFLEATPLQVESGTHGLVLRLDEFQNTDNSGEVLRMSERWASHANGLAKMQGIAGSFAVNGVFRVHDGGRRTQFVHASGVAVVGISAFGHATSWRADGTQIEVTQPKPLDYMAIANASRAASEMLQLLAALDGDDWGALCKIIEILEENGASLKAWGFKAAVSRITGTANSVHLLGVHAARHAKRNRGPISNPITYDEALGIVRQLVDRWFQTQNPQ
ncbi:hypothetical protein [Pseudomonas tohonis]|uniref:hypothetical protein n=1 Tax=Pseudomonas tohonis TaxID=2725477 RepID=UPI001F231E16|nr:hypothetical protein [Pseudomonas tohonis]